MTDKFVYAAVAEEEFVKIGITDNIRTRMQVIRTHNHREVELIGVSGPYKQGNAELIESRLQTGIHVRGEWYRKTDEEIDEIQRKLREDDFRL